MSKRMKVRDAAWLAGWLDGSGSFGFRLHARRSPAVWFVLTIANDDTYERIDTLLRQALPHPNKINLYTPPVKKPHHNPSWRLESNDPHNMLALRETVAEHLSPSRLAKIDDVLEQYRLHTGWFA